MSKSFRLPREQVNTLKERVLHPLRGRRYEVLQALDDVSFEVGAGEFFGIVGRNGSGKTTLMKSVAGIYGVDRGAIWTRGRVAPFIELGVGFNPDLAAYDNVLINAIMFGLSPREARRRYDSIIRFAELERFVDLKLKNYSSGMQVRLAFAVMVHVDADVLLIDEVLAVGDAAFQRKCHDALLAARDEGRTILLVTHDMNAVQRFCDRAMLIERGRVVAVGEPKTVARRYEEVNRNPDAPLEELAAQHVGDGSAAILEVWAEDEEGRRSEALSHGSISRLGMAVEFDRDVENPVFGFVVTDTRHRMVFSTSSAWKTPAPGHFRRGERIEVRASFQNLLAPGRYFVSPEVGRSGGTRDLMDHMENAAAFEVTGGRANAGMVDLQRAVEVTRVGAPASATAEER